VVVCELAGVQLVNGVREIGSPRLFLKGEEAILGSANRPKMGPMPLR